MLRDCIEEMASDDCRDVRLTARFLGKIYDLELANPVYISLVTIYNELNEELYDI